MILNVFYMRHVDDDAAEELREAQCARSDNDGKYCAESLFDGVANGDLLVCGETDDICIATCKDLRTLRNYWGCCTSSFEQYFESFPNTTQEYDDCDATLGEPCSSVSATPAFLVIAVLALITSIFFEYIHDTSCIIIIDTQISEFFCSLECIRLYA